jgi:hypothetical protein
MSKALSKIKLFDDPEFDKAARLEKFSMVLMDVRLEERLNAQEFEHWCRIQQCFALCHKQFDQQKAIRVIRNQIPGCERHEIASKIYREMCEVYGPFQNRNKAMARSIAAQRLWTIGVRLEQKGELLEAANVFKMAAEMEGLHREDVLDFDPDDIKLPEVHITNDPKYIHAEDTEFEEVENEENGEDEESIFP